MNVKSIAEELEKAIEEETRKLHQKFTHDVEQIAINLNSQFDLPQDEIKRKLSRKFSAKLNVEVDQADTQALMGFVVQFHKLVNILASSDYDKKKSLTAIQVNDFIFVPQICDDSGIPSSISVLVKGAVAPKGKIIMSAEGSIVVRTKRGETQYYTERGSPITDEVVLSILGNYIPKLNNHRKLT